MRLTATNVGKKLKEKQFYQILILILKVVIFMDL